jgi:hypothetical protein
MVSPAGGSCRPSLPDRRRRVALNALLVLVSILLTAIAAELLLRWVDYPRKEIRFMCYQPLLGNAFCPGAAGTVHGKSGARELRISAHGLADSPHQPERPAGAYRIALLGDSMVAGLDVAHEQRIGELWAQALSARLGRAVEVVNFSVPGTGTWEQLQTYHLRVRAFRPDLVVLAFYWGNDVWNNSARLARGGANPLHDDYRVRASDRARAIQRRISRWFWNHSIVYQVLRDGSDRFAELRRQAALHGWSDALTALRREVGAHAQPPAHLEPKLGLPEYDWSSPDWDLTRQLILKLNAKIRDDGLRLAVLQLPAIIHFRDQLPVAQFEHFLREQEIASFGVFDLYSSQSKQAFLRQFIAGDVHWNEQGHASAAQHTLPALMRIMALAPSRSAGN